MKYAVLGFTIHDSRFTIHHLPFTIQSVDQSRRQFLAETEDLIEQIFVDLEELREKREESKVRRELVDGIFRRIHRVKGSAASFGLDGLSGIANEFETLLSAVRSGRTVVDDDVLDTCEDATSALAESLQLASSGVVEPSRRALFDRIQILAEGLLVKPGLDIDTILSKVPSEIWQSLTDDEKQRLVQAAGEGTQICVVATSFDIGDFDDQFSRLSKKLGERGEVIATSPAVDAERTDKINFRVLFASKSDLRDVRADLAGFPVVLTEVAGIASPPGGGSQEGSLADRLRPTAYSLSNFIRTDLDELDRLISSTHELFRVTARALDLALSQTQAGGQVQEELKELDGKIRRSFLGVEKELIGLRMVSLGPILQRAARAGRAAARVSNKEIDFKIVGADLRLDRLLGDAIADPLIHLVRNAVDHGIETAEQSARLPERKRGLVRIEAASEGKQTCLRVIDNGRGVDPGLVSRAALRMGIIETDIVLDMDSCLRLIFRPGFTTLSSASTISGRGVGLDVVETAVEHVGGELRVSSEPGKGATFEIRLPVTFELLPSSIVLSGNSRYCIDARQVVKTEIIDASKIEKLEKGEVLKSDGEILPLVRLSELLGQSSNEPKAGPVHVVACEFPRRSGRETVNGNKRIGIIVDGVQETEEVLVRNLGRYAWRWSGIAGATELRDGTVALVLDLPRLIQDAVADN